jgi:hypothetical protein
VNGAEQIADERAPVSPDTDCYAVAVERAGMIRQGVANHLDLVAAAIEDEDWRVLDYPDVRAWYADVASLDRVRPEIRQRLVLALRAEEWSLRRIANELQVGKDTIARDLRSAVGQVSHDATPEPERVTGADGRSYAARRPAPADIAEPAAPATEATALLRKIIGVLDDAHDLRTRLTEDMIRDGADAGAVRALESHARWIRGLAAGLSAQCDGADPPEYQHPDGDEPVQS